MAEQEPETQQEEPQSRKKLPRWLAFILLIIAVFVVSVGAVVFTTKVVIPFLEQKQAPPATAKATDTSEDFIYEMAELTVNTSDPGGRRFVVVKIAFDVTSKKVKEDLEKNEIRFRDEFIAFFHEQSAQTILAPGFQDYARR